MQVYQVNNINFYFRTIVYWRSKDVDHILQGYKLNLQNAIGSKAPASLLNFYFKYTFCRKVSLQWNSEHSLLELIRQFEGI